MSMTTYIGLGAGALAASMLLPMTTADAQSTVRPSTVVSASLKAEGRAFHADAALSGCRRGSCVKALRGIAQAELVVSATEWLGRPLRAGEIARIKYVVTR